MHLFVPKCILIYLRPSSFGEISLTYFLDLKSQSNGFSSLSLSLYWGNCLTFAFCFLIFIGQSCPPPALHLKLLDNSILFLNSYVFWFLKKIYLQSAWETCLNFPTTFVKTQKSIAIILWLKKYIYNLSTSFSWQRKL